MQSSAKNSLGGELGNKERKEVDNYEKEVMEEMQIDSDEEAPPAKKEEIKDDEETSPPPPIKKSRLPQQIPSNLKDEKREEEEIEEETIMGKGGLRKGDPKETMNMTNKDKPKIEYKKRAKRTIVQST